jgi:hypothetical protein
MKDALGHGSEPRGIMTAHQTGVRKAVGLKVERHVAFGGVTAAGQRVTTTGNIWQKVAAGKRRAVAERIAQNTRVDNPNSIVRVR